MKISEIQNIPTSSVVSTDIINGYTLGMKNIYPDDDVPVYELRKFPISAYVSDIDPHTTSLLIQRMRNLSADVQDKKTELKNLASKVKTITAKDVEAAKLQPLENTIPYNDVTTQLTAKFATPNELQTAVNNVYTALFAAIEEMMVQVLTTSMYARQYNPIYDDVEVDYDEWKKAHNSTQPTGTHTG